MFFGKPGQHLFLPLATLHCFTFSGFLLTEDALYSACIRGDCRTLPQSTGFLLVDCLGVVQAVVRSSLRSGTNETFDVVRIFLLHVKIEDSIVKRISRAVRNWAVTFLLGTSFIEKLVRDIFSTGQKDVPYNSVPVLMIAIVSGMGTKRKTEQRKGMYSTCF